VDVLSSRILLRSSDLDRSHRFYCDVLGLAIYRAFDPLDDPGVVFFLSSGFLEISGHAAGPSGRSMMVWIQVRDVRAEHARLAAAAVPVIRAPAAEPWGLTDTWIEDPMASGSSWSRFPPITLCAVTRDRCPHHDDEPCAQADGFEPLRAGWRSFQGKPP
jgi:predicted enzyme related to lactoylglutathione lyase